MVHANRWLAAGFALLTSACGGCDSATTPAPAPTEPQPQPQPQADDAGPSTWVRMDFARPDFFAAPFPSDDLLSASGEVALDRFPNPANNTLVSQLVRLLARDARGFATSGGVFFTLTGPIDPASLPDLAGSVKPEASVALVSIDETSGNVAHQWPIHVGFQADGGPYGGPNLLSIVPLQGISLPANQTVAVVVKRTVKDTSGHAIGVSPELGALAAGNRPPGMSDRGFDAYSKAVRVLGPADLAGLAVFTTGDPRAQMMASVTEAIARTPTSHPAPVRGDVFDRYCVYSTTVQMPDYQEGTPPYAHEGGGWVRDDAGHLIVQRTVSARVVLTIPRSAPPTGGYPLTVMIRTGAGGDRPLVDRGAQAMTGGPALTPGSGLAADFARAGFAGASVDGPHSGARNPANGDEQFLMFNVQNVLSIRDSVRESAVELVVFEHWLESLSFDVSDCPGAGPGVVHFDPDRTTLLGHSMGATIGPLALAAEPRFRAAVFSGAGASWMENILYKQLPIAVRPAIDSLVGYQHGEHTLSRGDPVLTLMQWALEPADPLVYAPLVSYRPPTGAPRRHVLIEQGIVDHYIMPTISNAMNLALGVDLAGDALDSASPELAADKEQIPIASVLQFSGRRQVALPASGNVEGTTAVVRQHPADGVEDGHEILFQTEAPKAELRCFLASFANGSAPPVVTPDACPVPDGK